MTVMMIERCLLIILVLGALAPGLCWPEVAETAKNREHAAENRKEPEDLREEHVGPKRSAGKAHRQPQKDASTPHPRPRGYRRSRADVAVPTATAAARSSAAAAAPTAGIAAPRVGAPPPVAAAGGTQTPQAAVTPHFMPSSPRASNLTGAAGNTAARRASVPEVVGGPAKYDAKKGAVISGTVARQKG